MEVCPNLLHLKLNPTCSRCSPAMKLPTRFCHLSYLSIFIAYNSSFKKKKKNMGNKGHQMLTSPVSLERILLGPTPPSSSGFSLFHL